VLLLLLLLLLLLRLFLPATGGKFVFDAKQNP
jgi:hypothetical protein